jgi:P4 family phage/plasmid primase-like protien
MLSTPLTLQLNRLSYLGKRYEAETQNGTLTIDPKYLLELFPGKRGEALCTTVNIIAREFHFLITTSGEVVDRPVLVTHLQNGSKPVKSTRPLKCLCGNPIAKGDQTLVLPSVSTITGCATCADLSMVEDEESKGNLEIGSAVEVANRVLADFKGDGNAPDIVATRGKLHRYVDNVWSPIAENEFSKQVMSYDGKHQALKIGESFIKSVDFCAYQIAVDPAFDQKRAKGIAFRNGFLSCPDSGDFMLGPNLPEHRATEMSPFDYNASSECPKWIEQLHLVWPVDDVKERIQVLQEAVGLALIGHGARYQTMLLFVGPGQTGKSTILDTVERLFPASSVRSIPVTDWSHEQHVARLAGCKLNKVTELPNKAIEATARFKQIISGETIQVKDVYKVPYDVTPIALTISAMNEFFRETLDQTSGFWRRLVILGFDHKIENPTSKDVAVDALSRELPAIMVWALEGAARALKNDKLTTPSSSEQMKGELRARSDQASMFVTDCANRTIKALLEGKDIYPPYLEYMKATNPSAKPMSQNTLLGKLEHLGLRERITSGPDKGKMRYKVSIKPRDEWPCRPRNAKEEEDLDTVNYTRGLPFELRITLGPGSSDSPAALN